MIDTKYYMVVPGSETFIPGLEALFNSFAHYMGGGDIGVILLNYDLPKEFLFRKWPFPISRKQLPTNESPSVVCKLMGYAYTATLDRPSMLCDADYFFMADWTPYFDLAAAGWIVGSANGQNTYFTEQYEEQTKVKGIIGKWNYRTIAAPLIIDPPLHGKVFSDAVAAWRNIGDNHGTSIWMLMNAMLVKHGVVEKVVSIPAQQATNLHQKMLKTGTRVRLDRGMLMTEDGLQVIGVHDKWWREIFIDNLRNGADKFCKDDKGCKARWNQSIDLILKEFKRWRGDNNANLHNSTT